MSRDIYAEVTSALVAAIEKDPGDPIMPWHRGGAGQIPKNLITDHDYQGVNILNLWVAAHLAGFDSNLWGTYRQWREVGANVRKGEKASVIIFYKQVTKETDAGEDETYRVLKWFSVFNANQVDGWSPAPELSDCSSVETRAYPKIIASVYQKRSKTEAVLHRVYATPNVLKNKEGAEVSQKRPFLPQTEQASTAFGCCADN